LLALVILGQLFKPNGNIRVITNRRLRDRLAMAHHPDNGFAGMHPRAKEHFLIKIYFQLGIHIRYAVQNLGRLLHGIQALLLHVTRGTESRHDAIADKLVQPAAIGFDDSAANQVIFVTDVNDITGKIVLGNLCEFADKHRSCASEMPGTNETRCGQATNLPPDLRRFC